MAWAELRQVNSNRTQDLYQNGGATVLPCDPLLDEKAILISLSRQMHGIETLGKIRVKSLLKRVSTGALEYIDRGLN